MTVMAMVNALIVNVYVIKDSLVVIVVRKHVKKLITVQEMVNVIREFAFVMKVLQEIAANILYVLFQTVH